MDIFQTTTVSMNYRVTITSENPILVNYHDLVDMSQDLGRMPDQIASYLFRDDCPTPINQDRGTDWPLENGIWVYDRLLAFFERIENEAARAVQPDPKTGTYKEA